MNEQQPPDDEKAWHMRVEKVARAFPYPPTPDFSQTLQRGASQSRFQARRLAWAAGIALIVLIGSALSVPEIRAQVQRWLQIGVIQIVVEEPTITPISLPFPSYLDLAGETTLEAAREQVSFPIRLPEALGAPDHVYVQDIEGDLVILVWLDPAQPLLPRYLMYQIDTNFWGIKVADTIRETRVNDQRAVWVQGEHVLEFAQDGEVTALHARLIESPVLIWTEGDITYRLEGNAPMETVVDIAETLR
jgi:hypothetical protein